MLESSEVSPDSADCPEHRPDSWHASLSGSLVLHSPWCGWTPEHWPTDPLTGPSLKGILWDSWSLELWGRELEGELVEGSGKCMGTRGLRKRQEIFSLICSLTFESEIAVVAIQLVVSDSDFGSWGRASEVTITGHTLGDKQKKAKTGNVHT